MGKGGAEWRFFQQKKQSSAHFLQSSGRNDTFVSDNKQSFTEKQKTMLSIQTTDDSKTGAFKLLIDDEEVGIMEFYWENPDVFVITHTEVSPEHKGEGLGKELLAAAVDYARQKGKKIRPECSFVATYFTRYEEEYEDVAL